MLTRTVAGSNRRFGELGGTAQRHQTASATREMVTKLDQLIGTQRRCQRKTCRRSSPRRRRSSRRRRPPRRPERPPTRTRAGCARRTTAPTVAATVCKAVNSRRSAPATRQLRPGARSPSGTVAVPIRVPAIRQIVVAARTRHAVRKSRAENRRRPLVRLVHPGGVVARGVQMSVDSETCPRAA
jgi:hypothetical protein